MQFLHRIFLGTILLLFALLPKSTTETDILDGWLNVDSSLLETGDLIFRRGQGIGSWVVLDSDPQSPYSHVGIVLKQNEQVWVIHTVPTSAFGSNDVARMEPLETYLSLKNAAQAAVYRVQGGKQVIAKKAARIAETFVRDRIPFDSSFEVATLDELYCTELVWQAYLQAGLDLTDGKLDQLDLPFAEGKYILPSRLMHSPHLRFIAKISL